MEKCACELDGIGAASNAKIQKSLSQGSDATSDIRDLQRMLFETGYGKQLNYDKFGADGNYGKSTIAGVKAFAANNGLESDGKSVSKKLLGKLLSAHHSLESLYILFEDVSDNDVAKKYRKGGDRTSVGALQSLLNDLGFGKKLNFEKYGADGFYGQSTVDAVKALARQNAVPSDGSALTGELANLILEKFRPSYGEDWMALSKHMAATDGRRALVIYNGSNFIGKNVLADQQFVPLLDRVNDYAKAANVFLDITSSFRTTTNVSGAIVTPAKKSNHLAGHAIDMNVMYGANRGSRANSGVLRSYPKVPAPVKKFLRSIIDDGDLRWGGQFGTPDPVHIDDGLNVRSPATWKQRYALLQKTAQSRV